MADPLISDRQAELAWRLNRAIADPAEKSVNDTHVAELTRLIADALSPPQPKEPQHDGMDASVALVRMFMKADSVSTKADTVEAS